MKDAQEQLAFELRMKVSSDLDKSERRFRKFLESYEISSAAKAEMEKRANDFIEKAHQLCITHIEWERSRDKIWKEKIESSAQQSVKHLKIVAYSTFFVAVFSLAIAAVEILNLVIRIPKIG